MVVVWREKDTLSDNPKEGGFRRSYRAENTLWLRWNPSRRRRENEGDEITKMTCTQGPVAPSPRGVGLTLFEMFGGVKTAEAAERQIYTGTRHQRSL